MTWFALGVTFMIVWWLVLFMVLPFGAQPLDRIDPGMAPSAPARPRMGLKIVVTTLIAIALTAVIYWVIDTGLIRLRPA